MSARPRPLAIDPALLARYRAAGLTIAWRGALSRGRRRVGRRARIAHLHDEETRIEAWSGAGVAHVAVDSGPLGALVLLLEMDRRGPATALGARESGRDPTFPGGAIEAAWGGDTEATDSRPRLSDLVELARYALV